MQRPHPLLVALLVLAVGVSSCESPTAPVYDVAGDWKTLAMGVDRYSHHWLELSLIVDADSVRGRAIRWGLGLGPDTGTVRGTVDGRRFGLEVHYVIAATGHPFTLVIEGEMNSPGAFEASYDDGGLTGSATFYRVRPAEHESPAGYRP